MSVSLCLHSPLSLESPTRPSRSTTRPEAKTPPFLAHRPSSCEGSEVKDLIPSVTRRRSREVLEFLDGALGPGPGVKGVLRDGSDRGTSGRTRDSSGLGLSRGESPAGS